MELAFRVILASLFFILAVQPAVASQELKDQVEGKYKVTNVTREQPEDSKKENCFLGDRGTDVTIEVSSGVKLIDTDGGKHDADKLEIIVGKAIKARMYETRSVTSDEPNDVTVKRDGTTVGNGFLYGEQRHKGRQWLSHVEYSLLWQGGQLVVERKTYTDPKHKTVSYCDLHPVK